MYLLDTNAVSEIANDAYGAVGTRARLVGYDRLCTSVLVVAEIRYGIAKRPSKRLEDRMERVLGAMTVHAFVPPAETIYGTLRADLESNGRVIGQMDMLITAHAIALDCILVTDNVDEFARVPGLRVENWLRSA